MDYLIKLDNYEGPLDRLLRMVEKQEIDAATVPVYAVIRQFVECLAAVSYADIDGGGRFLVLAATLMAIKAQVLLPQQESAAGEEGVSWDESEAADAFAIAVETEYLKIKEAARTLEDYARNWVQSYKRPVVQVPDKPTPPDIRDDIARLVTAFKEILDRTAFEPGPYQVELAVDFEQKMEAVFSRVARAKSSGLPFQQLFVNADRLEVIYSFLAILELVFRGRLRLSQMNKDDELLLVAVKKK